MTTYALDVTAHFYGTRGSRAQPATLYLTTPEESSVSYSYVDELGNDQKIDPEGTASLAVTLQSELLSGRLEWDDNGEALARQVSFSSSEIYVSDLLWQKKRTTVAIWDVKDPGSQSVEVVISLNGDKLPDIGDFGQYMLWINSISQVRTPDAANLYSPGKALDFSQIALWSTENDVGVNTAGNRDWHW